jgi:hypothetical protein
MLISPHKGTPSAVLPSSYVRVSPIPMPATRANRQSSAMEQTAMKMKQYRIARSKVRSGPPRRPKKIVSQEQAPEQIQTHADQREQRDHVMIYVLKLHQMT